jgi:hypothetical protein
MREWSTSPPKVQKTANERATNEGMRNPTEMPTSQEGGMEI